MSYAFEYRGFNRVSQEQLDDDRYADTTKDEVRMTVKAEDEAGALEAVQALVTRDVFKLLGVVELSEDLMPIKGD